MGGGKAPPRPGADCVFRSPVSSCELGDICPHVTTRAHSAVGGPGPGQGVSPQAGLRPPALAARPALITRPGCCGPLSHPHGALSPSLLRATSKDHGPEREEARTPVSRAGPLSRVLCVRSMELQVTPGVVQDGGGLILKPLPPSGRRGWSCPALGLSFPICSVDLMFPSPPSFPVLRIRRTEQVEWAGATGGQDRAILVEPAPVNPGASLPTEDPWGGLGSGPPRTGFKGDGLRSPQ